MRALTATLLHEVIALSEVAGQKILSLYAQADAAIIQKSDGTPLTAADQLAHHTILAGLKNITPDVPVISEESTPAEIERRRDWHAVWLVDPLDGTQEFIHRTHEFTVNIALILHHQPVLGVVHAPALGVTYYALQGQGAYKKTHGRIEQIFAAQGTDVLRVIASRRHGDPALKKFLQQLPAYTLSKAGSALKICCVAEGAAHLYPRLGPTAEWDTAAGHAIVHNAGGMLYDRQQRTFLYNARKTLLNDFFVVSHRATQKFQLD